MSISLPLPNYLANSFMVVHQAPVDGVTPCCGRARSDLPLAALFGEHVGHIRCGGRLEFNRADEMDE
jgi:hypothetical protein